MDTLQRIESLVRKRGWSKSEFFRRMRLPNNTLAAWQRGLNHSWEKHLPRIAEVLGTTPAYLLGETDDPASAGPETPRDLRVLIGRLQSLPEGEQQRVLDALTRTADQVIAQLRAEGDPRLPAGCRGDDPSPVKGG